MNPSHGSEHRGSERWAERRSDRARDETAFVARANDPLEESVIARALRQADEKRHPEIGELFSLASRSEEHPSVAQEIAQRTSMLDTERQGVLLKRCLFELKSASTSERALSLFQAALPGLTAQAVEAFERDAREALLGSPNHPGLCSFDGRGLAGSVINACADAREAISAALTTAGLDVPVPGSISALSKSVREYFRLVLSEEFQHGDADVRDSAYFMLLECSDEERFEIALQIIKEVRAARDERAAKTFLSAAKQIFPQLSTNEADSVAIDTRRLLFGSLNPEGSRGSAQRTTSPWEERSALLRPFMNTHSAAVEHSYSSFGRGFSNPKPKQEEALFMLGVLEYLAPILSAEVRHSTGRQFGRTLFDMARGPVRTKVLDTLGAYAASSSPSDLVELYSFRPRNDRQSTTESWIKVEAKLVSSIEAFELDVNRFTFSNGCIRTKDVFGVFRPLLNHSRGDVRSAAQKKFFEVLERLPQRDRKELLSFFQPPA